MLRRWAVALALALAVGLSIPLSTHAQNLDCCQHVGRVGTCVRQTRLGLDAGRWECLPLPARDVRSSVQVLGCRTYNMAAELFGGSSCQPSAPGSDTSTCRESGDPCFVIDAREARVHRAGQRVECVKGDGLLPTAALVGGPKRITKGQCQVKEVESTW